MRNLITATTVNFKTPELVYDCLNTFRNYYPDVPHIVIDNGGCEKSLDLLRKMYAKDFITTLIENPENRYHGPALNQGLDMVSTPYAFLLDSDTRTNRGGFLEKMLDLFENDDLLFAVGWLRKTGPTGVAYRKQDEAPEAALDYIHPYACLLDVAKFRETRGFTDGGAPAAYIMHDARELGYHVSDFPIQEYLWHKEAGTRGLFGGQFKPATDMELGQWKRYKI